MKRLFKYFAIALTISITGIVLFTPASTRAQLSPAAIEADRNRVRSHASYPISTAAQSLHDSMIIGDWHADSLLWKRDLLEKGTRGHADIPRLLAGNVALQMFTAVTKSPANNSNETGARDNITLLAMAQLWPPRTWNSLLERALYQSDKLHDFAARSDTLRVITTQSDIDQLLADRAAGQQVVGGLLGIEGAHPLEGDITNLDRLEDAGFRLIALQHFFDNALGGSLHGAGNQGLTDFGKQVVTQIEQRNLILDLAHSSQRVVRDVLAITDMPIVVSHTGIFGVCPSQRNFPDALMQDIAETGGIIAIGYWRTVLCDDAPKGIAGTIKAAIDLLGEDHVSLGSDFDGSVTTALDTSELAAITQALLDANLTESQIRKVMGENMLRVLRDRLPE